MIVVSSSLGGEGVPSRFQTGAHNVSTVVDVWNGVRQAEIGSVIVDCLEDGVQEALREAGAYAVRTAPKDVLRLHNQESLSGMRRLAGTVTRFDRFCNHDLVINVPDGTVELEPVHVQVLMYALASSDVGIATFVIEEEPQEGDDSSVFTSVAWNPARRVYVAPDCQIGTAMDFQRQPISFPGPPFFRHVPIFAYRRSVLDRLARVPPTGEDPETEIEILTALRAGFRVEVCLITGDFTRIA